MEYQAAVAEARRLDEVIEEAEVAAEEAKWARAELAHAQVQSGTTRAQWARDTGKDKSTIGLWVQMWERWGLDRDQRPAFSEGWNIVLGRADRAAQYGSQYAGEAAQAVRNMPPQQKAEVVREALADPATAEQVVADPHTDATITRARMRRDDQRETGVRDRAHQEAPGLIHHSRIYGGLVDMDAAERRLADALTQFQEIDLDDGDRAKITERVDAVRRMLDAITAHVTSGQRFDDELAQLLDGSE